MVLEVLDEPDEKLDDQIHHLLKSITVKVVMLFVLQMKSLLVMCEPAELLLMEPTTTFEPLLVSMINFMDEKKFSNIKL